MNKKQKDRLNRLMPNGIPRYVHCYDNGDITYDRYTVVYTRTGRSGSNRHKPITTGQHQYVSMSENPFHPQGYGQHGASDTPIDYPSYSHLGKKIKFEDLPEDCKKLVLQDYKEIWELNINV